MFRGVNYEKKQYTTTRATKFGPGSTNAVRRRIHNSTATERTNILPFAWRSELVNYV